MVIDGATQGNRWSTARGIRLPAVVACFHGAERRVSMSRPAKHARRTAAQRGPSSGKQAIGGWPTKVGFSRSPAHPLGKAGNACTRRKWEWGSRQLPAPLQKCGDRERTSCQRADASETDAASSLAGGRSRSNGFLATPPQACARRGSIGDMSTLVSRSFAARGLPPALHPAGLQRRYRGGIVS